MLDDHCCGGYTEQTGEGPGGFEVGHERERVRLPHSDCNNINCRVFVVQKFELLSGSAQKLSPRIDPHTTVFPPSAREHKATFKGFSQVQNSQSKSLDTRRQSHSEMYSYTTILYDVSLNTFFSYAVRGLISTSIYYFFLLTIFIDTEASI